MGLEIMAWNLHWMLFFGSIVPLIVLFELTRAPGARENRRKFHKWGGLYWLAIYGVLVAEIAYVGVVFAGAPAPFRSVNVFTWFVKLLFVVLFALGLTRLLQVPFLEELKVRKGMKAAEKKRLRQRRAFTWSMYVVGLIAGGFFILFVIPWAFNGWAYQGGVASPDPGADSVFNSKNIARWGWYYYFFGLLILFDIAYPLFRHKGRMRREKRRAPSWVGRHQRMLTLVLVNVLFISLVSLIAWMNFVDSVSALVREALNWDFRVSLPGDLGQIDFGDPAWLEKYIAGTDWTNWLPSGDAPTVDVPDYDPITGGEEYGTWPPSWWPF